MSISPQRRQEIIDALRRGTVPQNSLDAFAVGLDRFAEALSEELSELGFIISFYSAEGRSYSPSLTARQLYHWMNWMYINFYLIIQILILPLGH